MRVLRTCRELGLETVAIFSEADREAPHVRYADEAYCLGPPQAAESYLREERIIQVALEAGAQAVHPGYGFLAESPKFARACADAGLTFVGPSPEAMELLGDKPAARRVAHDLGIYVIDGSAQALDDNALLDAAERIGYPVMLKATAGGGGMGIRAASSQVELEAAIPLARREAQAAFDDDRVYLREPVSLLRCPVRRTVLDYHHFMGKAQVLEGSQGHLHGPPDVTFVIVGRAEEGNPLIHGTSRGLNALRKDDTGIEYSG